MDEHFATSQHVEMLGSGGAGAQHVAINVRTESVCCLSAEQPSTTTVRTAGSRVRRQPHRLLCRSTGRLAKEDDSQVATCSQRSCASRVKRMRQVRSRTNPFPAPFFALAGCDPISDIPVSYTHLTLPTNREV